MTVMAIVKYPLKSARQVAKLYTETMKVSPPDFLTRGESYMRYADQGITSYSIFEIAEGHEIVGLKILAASYVACFDIEGFEVELPVVLTTDESVSLLGM